MGTLIGWYWIGRACNGEWLGRGCYRKCEWSALVVCPCGAFREGRNAVAEHAAILQHGFSWSFLPSAVFWMEDAFVFAACLEIDHLESPCLCHYLFPLWFSNVIMWNVKKENLISSEFMVSLISPNLEATVSPSIQNKHLQEKTCPASATRSVEMQSLEQSFQTLSNVCSACQSEIFPSNTWSLQKAVESADWLWRVFSLVFCLYNTWTSHFLNFSV